MTLGSKDDYPKAGIYLGIILHVSPCSSTLPPRYQCHSAGGVLLKFLTATHLMQRLICVPGLCLCFGDVLQPGGVVRHPPIRRAERNAQRENATYLSPGLAIRSAGVLVHVLLQSIHELIVLIFGTCHCQAGIIRRKTLIASTVKTWCCKNPWFPCGAGAVRLFQFLSEKHVWDTVI